MARGHSSRVSGGGAAPPPSERDRIIDAALSLIAQQGWRRLSLAAVAAEADVPILALYRVFRSKPAILCGFSRRIDEATLATPLDAEEGERPRDRLFDLLMRRFDALRPYRAALEMLGRELATDPPAALGAGARLLCSIAWMLEAAGISTAGLGGIVALKLTAAVYLATLRVWLRDDSPDLAPTMAALDRRLRAIERWLGTGRRPRPDANASRA
ncbi:MAG TPA: TetR family transcriptional regulator [Stellaceae bacterium]|nr:TetR family transcriptional regulator [Stellaceae bacterium]